MKYKVTITFTAEYNTDIEADSEEDAISLAEERCSMAESGDFDIYDAYDISVERI